MAIDAALMSFWEVPCRSPLTPLARSSPTSLPDLVSSLTRYAYIDLSLPSLLLIFLRTSADFLKAANLFRACAFYSCTDWGCGEDLSKSSCLL